MRKWQFICDSVYDLVHLQDKFGQKTIKEWWYVRLSEWFGVAEYNKRWGRK